MPKLEVVNANNIIEYSPQKANFKLKNTGGPKGEPGAQGPKGDTGPQGPAGPQGIQGEKGDKGAQGERGPQGIQGPQGPQGIQGPKGDKGDKGNTGATGPQGPQGPAGQNGTDGADGVDGFSPIATVTQEGLDAEISITDKNGTTTATVPGFGVQVVESLPATGSSNVIYLERDSNSASGNPISIADAVEAPLKSLEIQGNTTQQTYTGSNPVHGNFTNVTEGGLTWEYDKSTGEFYVHGTAASTYSVPTYILFDTPLPAGQYTFFITEQISGARPGIGLRKANGSSRVASPIAAGSLSATVDNAEEKAAYDIYLTGMTVGSTINVRFKCMLVAGTSTTTYEPYVGGVPAPNPDYPQAVQTVTGENILTISDGQGNDQSYVINLGKNLFDKDNASTIGAYIAGGTSTIVTDGANTSIYIPCQPNTTYTISKTADNVFRAGTTSVVPANGVAVKNMTDNASGTKITLTSASDARYLVVFIRNNASSHTAAELMATIQIEKGSTATSYAAYFAPIELCKIGDYQDSIYKSSGKWYVRKETGKRTYTAGDITIAASDTYSNVRYAQFPKGADNKQYGNYTYGDIINFFTHGINMGAVPAGGWNSYISDGLIYNSAMQDNYWCSFSKSTVLATMQEKLNGMVAYYVLATPTDTEITNAALIAQLEVILAGGTQAGANTIALTPSAGATGTLEVEYYDSYDSYLWVNNRWEKFAHLG